MSYTRKKRGRDISGLLVLNKPPKHSSNQALQIVKNIYGAQKLGHTGSLDPIATGVLPLCFGHATKFSQFLLESDKKYKTQIKLGEKTTTGDCEGEVISSRPVAITEQQVEQGLQQFRGEIEQIPPMYSAIKHQGQPLYKLAREGITIDRKPRKVTIHSITLDAIDNDILTISVHCTKGTYVRSIADDLGEWLGCGAHITELQRTQAGPYTLEQAYSLDDLYEIRNDSGHNGLDQLLLPVSSAVEQLPTVNLAQVSAYYLKKGQAIQVPHAPKQGWVQLFEGAGEGSNDSHEFIGVGEVLDDGRIAPRRMILSTLSG